MVPPSGRSNLAERYILNGLELETRINNSRSKKLKLLKHVAVYDLIVPLSGRSNLIGRYL